MSERMEPEYDFSGGERGKHYGKYWQERAEAADARVQALTVALRDARNALAYLDQHPFVGADAELAAIDAALAEPRREPECEGTSNPFVAECGAKFDTYEEMAQHQRERHPADPRREEEREPQ